VTYSQPRHKAAATGNNTAPHGAIVRGEACAAWPTLRGNGARQTAQLATPSGKIKCSQHMVCSTQRHMNGVGTTRRRYRGHDCHNVLARMTCNRRVRVPCHKTQKFHLSGKGRAIFSRVVSKCRYGAHIAGAFRVADSVPVLRARPGPLAAPLVTTLNVAESHVFP